MEKRKVWQYRQRFLTAIRRFREEHSHLEIYWKSQAANMLRRGENCEVRQNWANDSARIVATMDWLRDCGLHPLFINGKVSYCPKGRNRNNWKQRQETTLQRFIERNAPDSIRAPHNLEMMILPRLIPLRMRFLSGKDITEAYRREIGGHSCMSGGDCNKVKVYGENPEVCELLIAYLGEDSESSLEDIETSKDSARALVWQTDGGVMLDRVYYSGKCSGMTDNVDKAMLAHVVKSYPSAQVFRNENYFGQQRVVLTNAEPVIWPYFDTMQWGSNSEDGKYTLCTHRTGKCNHQLRSTQGVGPDSVDEHDGEERCQNCEEWTDEDDICEGLCTECYSDLYTQCEHCENDSRANSVTTVQVDGGTEEWCERCVRRHATECEHCREITHDDIMVEIGTPTGDESWCEGCADDYSVRCAHCDERCEDDYCEEHNGDNICWDCIDEVRDAADAEDESEIVTNNVSSGFIFNLLVV